MLLLIDNYDSFTGMLAHDLQSLGADVKVVRCDALTVAEALALSPAAIVISPGPATPDQAGISLPLIRAAAGHKIPLLGVCLGHQALGQAFGGHVIRAPTPVHGMVWPILHTGASLFQGLPSPLPVTRYHSLILDRASLPDCFDITAETTDGLIMAISHKTLPLHGVQFHPESVATQNGRDLLAAFLQTVSS
jgi:anthranilate synthase component II